MVVVLHSSFYVAAKGQLHGGTSLAFAGIAHLWLGVPLFFVISGYCISSTCDSMRRTSLCKEVLLAALPKDIPSVLDRQPLSLRRDSGDQVDASNGSLC